MMQAVIVGCGRPLRSMGWYHATQILQGRCQPEAKLRYVVEPFYLSELGEKIDPEGTAAFKNWKARVEEEHGVEFFASTASVPAAGEEEQRLAIISSRTSDNPKLFAGCVDELRSNAIFLEKPGAPTVGELEKMSQMAKDSGCRVFMGFNKNVSSYLARSRAYANGRSGCELTFLHNNNYQNTKEELSECFERNAEGMLKNMAIHELAILVTYFGVSVETIASVEADKAYSSCQTLKGPTSGASYTDFDRLKFRITTKDGTRVNVAADRCGGDDSVAIVTDAASGAELDRYTMPDEDAVRNIPVLKGTTPGAMPYFYAQDPDYLELKRRVIQSCLDGTDPEGVATIDVAIDTLKVAEYLTPILQEQLS